MGDILPLLQQGDLFVSASQYEGFPNALLEAMACGLPAVCFDCESGPAEIVRQGVDGLLVPNGDDAGLERALRELMQDAGRREEMGRAARDVSERFSREKFFTAWDSLLTATSR
ncbi:MAG: glycosyltransferase [Planctomycetales bacterium]